MSYKHINIPSEGTKITLENGSLVVPDNPIIPFIEGDGIGVDITPAMIDVVDNAVKVAYGGIEKRYLGWKFFVVKNLLLFMIKILGLPDETIDALKEYIVSIKGSINYTSWRRHQVVKCISKTDS